MAPTYHDMYVAVGGTRARVSLRRLQPGEVRSYFVEGVDSPGNVKIECDMLVPGQTIQFSAKTTGKEKFEAVTPSEMLNRYAYFAE